MNDKNFIKTIESIKQEEQKNDVNSKNKTKSLNPDTEHIYIYIYLHCSRFYFDIKLPSDHACENEMKKKSNQKNKLILISILGINFSSLHPYSISTSKYTE